MIYIDKLDVFGCRNFARLRFWMVLACFGLYLRKEDRS